MIAARHYFVEGWEALRTLRYDDWSALINGTHGLSSAGGFWHFSGTDDSYQGFTRSVTVADVRRDPSGNIVGSGGEIDPDSKKITITVSWSPVSAKTLSLTTESYLTNFYNPSVWPPETP